MTTCILDTETTSKADDREPIEVALLQLPMGRDLFGENPDVIPQSLVPLEPRFVGRLKPMKPLTFGSIAVHHILPSELEDCPPASSFVLPDDVAYIVGHSVDFDHLAIGSPKQVKRICTFAMAEHIWPDADSHSQSALLYMLLGATAETREMLRGAHSAETDARNNAILLRFILSAKPEIKTWSALWSFSEEARVPIFCPLKRWDGVRLEEMDDGAINWCLRQDWIDPYFRKGLERVMEDRYQPRRREPEAAAIDEIEDSEIPF